MEPRRLHFQPFFQKMFNDEENFQKRKSREFIKCSQDLTGQYIAVSLKITLNTGTQVGQATNRRSSGPSNERLITSEW